MAKRREKEPLVGVVVVTHGRAAYAMLSSARAILGRVISIVAVSIKVGEDLPVAVDRIARACEEVDQGGGILLLVDVHGSTPFNAAMAMLDGTRPAEVLCGVNLPMLIKLTTVNRRLTSPVAIAEELRDCGRRAIRLGSELTGKVALSECRHG